MQNMQSPGERPVEVRLGDLEQRMDSLETVGQGGLPAVRLTSIEKDLEHLIVDVDRRFNEVDRRFSEGDKRFDRLETRVDASTNRLTLILGLCTGIITLAVVLSQLFLP